MEHVPPIVWLGLAVAIILVGYGIKELLYALAERIRPNFWRMQKRTLDNSNPLDWDQD